MMMESDPNASTILALLKHTATSLRKSFANYWPADDRNDPVERNVSLHFAHAMLSAGFSTFAEADHPDRATIRGIDVFGLAPNNTWFLGCEFKRLYSAEKLLSLATDMQRLSSFQPRIDYSPSIYGPTFAAAASCCKQGYGVVGGLHWLAGDKPSSQILDVWISPDNHASNSAYGEVVDRMRTVQAVLPEPLPIIEFPTGGRYYLLAAMFSIPPPLKLMPAQ